MSDANRETGSKSAAVALDDYCAICYHHKTEGCECEMKDEDETIPEDNVHMEDCTCPHSQDEHGWGECQVEGCPCEGGWTE